MASSTSEDPTGWKLTSVRWLYQKRHIERHSVKGAHAQLLKALVGMKLFDAEEEAHKLIDVGSMKFTSAERARVHCMTHWNQAAHELMVDFLESGGYEARAEELSGKLRLETDDPEAAADFVAVVSSPVTTSTRRYPDQDLEEALAEELRNLNPQANSW